VTTPEQLAQHKAETALNLLVTVRVDNDKLLVEHSEEGGFKRQINGLDSASLMSLQALMTEIKTKYPQNQDVTVIPSDDVSYENVVHVLERLKLSHFTGISLGTRSRGAAAPGA
jgi:biopolymer transport protein ExbD